MPCSMDGTFPYAPTQPMSRGAQVQRYWPQTNMPQPFRPCIRLHSVPSDPTEPLRKTVGRSTASQLGKSFFSWCHYRLVHSQFSRSPHLLGESSTEHKQAKVMLPGSVASPVFVASAATATGRGSVAPCFGGELQVVQ